MKKILGVGIAMVALASLVQAGDVTQKASYSVTDGGRENALKDLVVTDVPAIVTEINRLNDYVGTGGVLEGASLAVDGAGAFGGAVTVTSTNGASTNVVITVNAQVDGEYIANDTIDDDSIDFADVTSADLTFDTVNWTNTATMKIDGATAVTTNQTFLSATGVTNTLVIVDGLIKAIQ